MVYKLAAPSTPPELRQAIVNEIATGGVIDYRAVEERMVAAKEAVREEKATERAAELAEREKQAEISAWQKCEKDMRAAGKTDAEVDAEKKRWDTKKAMAERKRESAQSRKDKSEKEK